MCGRWSLVAMPEALAERFHADVPDLRLTQRYNIAPSQEALIITNEDPDHFSVGRFGLVPARAKEEKTGYSMINARSETLLSKPAYRRPFQKQRCLVPADGFYEWKKTANIKVPYRIALKDSSVFSFACIYDVWPGKEKPVVSFSIITVGPNKMLGKIHNRMPVILSLNDERKWLEERPMKELLAMLRPYPDAQMNIYQISSLINNPRNETPEVLLPVRELGN